MTENAVTRINSSTMAPIPESAPAWHHAIAEDAVTAWDALDRMLLTLSQYIDDGDEQAAIFKREFGRAVDKVIGLVADELWPLTDTGDDG
jgi:hypothetical protein